MRLLPGRPRRGAALAALSLALSCAAVAVQWVLRPHLDEKQASWQARWLAARADHASATRRPEPRRSPHDTLQQLPSPDTRKARQVALLTLPGRHGLQAAGAEISTQVDASLGVVQWRVQQSWRGRYTEVGAALRDALAADPALALEQLRIHRRTPEAAEVEAEVAWLMLWRQGRVERTR